MSISMSNPGSSPFESLQPGTLNHDQAQMAVTSS